MYSAVKQGILDDPRASTLAVEPKRVTRQEDTVIDLVNNNRGETQWKAAPLWTDQGEDSSEDEDDQDPMEMDEDYEEEPQEVAVRIHRERSIRVESLQIPPNRW
ncbi:hypothetical protein M422DRAFT_245217 [Sphaerobolus stellatus SS14]|nr:hypothetical protein M422DRAFT_245217 [Sphaerobolus stellatus SS14]